MTVYFMGGRKGNIIVRYPSLHVAISSDITRSCQRDQLLPLIDTRNQVGVLSYLADLPLHDINIFFLQLTIESKIELYRRISHHDIHPIQVYQPAFRAYPARFIFFQGYLIRF